MDQDSAHMVAASKVPMLKPGEFELWRMRIEQYIQMIDYALWEVIENGATLPKTQVVEGVTTVMPITSAEDKAQRRLEVKARSTLMMGIPNEHQLKFNSIKDANMLLEAVEKRFGGNAATKKTQRNLLKQEYENFTTSSSEMLDQTFDRLQKLVSQLELLDEKLSQEDVNQKLLRSLSPEWNTHVVVWRNKAELETMSMVDLYNNLKVYEPEVKRMSSLSSSTQNIDFVSSSNNNTSSSNEVVNAARRVTTASTQDLQQIHPDDIEEMDLRWQMAMLTMRARRFLKNTGRKLTVNGNETIGFDKSKVECYNCHKRGHFARECRAPRNQDNKNKESSRRSVPSDQAEEGPNYALMAYSSSSSDSEVSNDSNCSKSCMETVKLLKSQNDQLLRDLEKSSLMVLGYKTVENKKSDVEVSKVVRKSDDSPIIKDWVSNSKEENVSQTKTEKKTVKPSIVKKDSDKSKQQQKLLGKLLNKLSNIGKTLTVQENLFPRAVLMKSGLVSVNTARQVNTAHSKTIVNAASPIVAKTPQQNGVAERRNRTLIEPAETMLADSKSIRQNLHGQGPDEGFFIGYSLNSKAFRVFNSRTRIVEENLHIRFSESTPNAVGSGPDWLFDIDALTRTMNYEPIVAGTQSNGFACTKASDNAGQARKETEPVKDYILLPLWTVDPPYSQDPKSSHDDGSKPSSDDGKKVDEDPRKDSECNDQEKEDNVNSTNNVNAAGTNEVNAIGGKTSIELPFDLNIPALEDVSIFNFSRDDEDDGAEADMNNLDTTIQVSPIPTIRIHKDHPLDQVIRDLQSATQTRKMSKNLKEHGKNPKRNKKDERGIMIRNKARLVAQGYTQEEGIDYDEVFAPVARIKAIRLFLAYASYKDFVVYQMDVKSAFLYEKIEEEVYVCQPPGFEDPDFPDRVYKVEKALYGLHQAPRAWYETLSTYLLDNGFQRGKIDKTLFIKRHKGDILLVQVYVDDIIFSSTNKELCNAFEKIMREKFQMSSMRELTFF
ncbi:putative ribonuclease H-like domain-containing protein [Tanacetum coccineum]